MVRAFFQILFRHTVALCAIRLRSYVSVCLRVFSCACNRRGREVTRALKERRETRGRQGCQGDQASLGDQDSWWVSMDTPRVIFVTEKQSLTCSWHVSGTQRRVSGWSTRPPWGARFTGCPRLWQTRTGRPSWTTGASRTPCVTLKIWLRYNSSFYYFIQSQQNESVHIVLAAEIKQDNHELVRKVLTLFVLAALTIAGPPGPPGPPGPTGNSASVSETLFWPSCWATCK